MDEQGNPLAVAVAPETHGAILLGDGPATLPRLLSRYGLDHEGAAQAEAWWDSWAMEDQEGAVLRSRIYPLASGGLLPVLGAAGVEALLGENALTLAAAEAVASLMDSQDVSQALERARDLHREARAALREGRMEHALQRIMETSDALWKLSPAHVATELLDEARMAMGRNREDATYSEEELIRIRRLIHGASEALEAGDYPGAIRRAYYACQLLGASPP